MFDGRKLKIKRIEAGLQQMEVAEKIGCKGTEIWRYEDGRVKPRPDRILQLAKALNCKPEDFEDTSSLPQAGSGGFSKDDMAIIQALIAMDPIRRAKIVGYVDGYLASGSPSAAALASEVAQALESSPNAAQKLAGRPVKRRYSKS